MAEEEQGTAAGKSESGGRGTSKIVLIASFVNLAATIAIVAVLVIWFQRERARPSVEDIVSGQVKKSHGEAKASGERGEAKSGHGEGASAEGESTVTDSGKIIPLEPFTVNLASGIATFPRYVRINVSIELEPGVPDKEFEIKLPRVRDTIINLLNSKKASDINTVEGRERLKEEIKKSINGFMLQSKVKGVYFTNFAISNP